MKEKTKVIKVFYFSGGAASQYKIESNFINLAHHKEDSSFVRVAFFATSHRMEPCHGIRGTVKCQSATPL